MTEYDIIQGDNWWGMWIYREPQETPGEQMVRITEDNKPPEYYYSMA